MSPRERIKARVKWVLANPYYINGLFLVDLAIGAALPDLNPMGDDPSWIKWNDLICGLILSLDIAAKIVSTRLWGLGGWAAQSEGLRALGWDWGWGWG